VAEMTLCKPHGVSQPGCLEEVIGVLPNIGFNVFVYVLLIEISASDCHLKAG